MQPLLPVAPDLIRGLAFLFAQPLDHTARIGCGEEEAWPRVKHGATMGWC